MDIRRGDVVVVDLDPIIGSETGKKRPCLIIQNDVGNQYSPVTIIAVITSRKEMSRKYPVDVWVAKGEGGLELPSIIQCDQIRTVDKRRIITNVGRLDQPSMDRVDEALKLSLGIRC